MEIAVVIIFIRRDSYFTQKSTLTIKVPGKPNYIIPNYDGKGYGHFTLDDEYTTILPKRLLTTRNDLNRYALLQTIHDNYLLGRIPSSHFGELHRCIMTERNPLIISTAVDHMFKIAFDMPADKRKTLELCMMDLIDENHTIECRQHIIRKLSQHATSPELINKLFTIWQQHNDPLFSERDYMNMAYRLAIVRSDISIPVLNTQRKRLRNDVWVSKLNCCSSQTRTTGYSNLRTASSGNALTSIGWIGG